MNTTATESVLYHWSFGSAEFDEGRWELRVGEAVVDLARKPLDVLQYLLHHAGEAVTKEELLATVWEGRIVVEAVLTNAIAKLRKALGDDDQRLISTLPKVGYRLEGTVHRRIVEYVPEASRLSTGDLVPRRPNWALQEALARHGDGEVWRARHIKTGQSRVFKFSLDGRRLASLKREVTIGRLLEQSLGPRTDLVRVIDWGFEQAPYFIEFEDGGMSLDHWEGFDALALEARLALFVEAADTVAAAHGVGVLHKDLKPANLLVYGEEDHWHLRVADFGSSQMLEPDMLDQLGITRLGFTQTQAISPESGTPLYMAPEVLAGQSPTIKSDVYAFGVTLYQMIVGDFRRPLSAGWENDIPDPLLRADIAAAANGDPTRRPESVATLAEGIRNLEQRRQKAALEASVRDRIAVAERRAALARARRPWIAAAMLVLITGTAISLFYARQSLIRADQIQVEARKAEEAKVTAQAVTHFLAKDVIGANSFYATGKKDTTLDQALTNAEAKIPQTFAGKPKTEAAVRIMLGQTYEALGRWDLANDQYGKVVKLAAAHPEVGQEIAIKSRLFQATSLMNLGHLSEVEELLTPVAKALDDGELRDATLQTVAYYTLGQWNWVHEKPTEAVRMLEKSHDASLHATDFPLRSKLAVDALLGGVLQQSGRYDEGIRILKGAYAKALAALGPTNPMTLRFGVMLVLCESGGGHTTDAQRDLDSVRPMVAKTLGADSSSMMDLELSQAAIWNAQKLWPRSLQTYSEIYPHIQKIYGKNNVVAINAGIIYTDVARLSGDEKLAQQLMDGLDAQIKTLPTDAAAPQRAQLELVNACSQVTQGYPDRATVLAKTIDAALLKKSDPAGKSVKVLQGLLQSKNEQLAACSTTVI
jgi:non-specific serine/threonine protein kinase